MKTDVEILKTFGDAYALAEKIHSGQVDKAGKSYILHPLRLAATMYKSQYDSEKKLKLMVVAILHDVVEDSNQIFPEDIKRQFGADIANAVDAISRRKGETYKAFILRCSENSLASIVKLADLEDNLNILRLAECETYSFEERDFARMKKYIHAYRFLKYGKKEEYELI